MRKKKRRKKWKKRREPERGDENWVVQNVATRRLHKSQTQLKGFLLRFMSPIPRRCSSIVSAVPSGESYSYSWPPLALLLCHSPNCLYRSPPPNQVSASIPFSNNSGFRSGLLHFHLLGLSRRGLSYLLNCAIILKTMAWKPHPTISAPNSKLKAGKHFFGIFFHLNISS